MENEISDDEINTEIFVKIDGDVPNISAETFLKVTKGMFEIMRDVDAALHDGKPSVKWEVAELAKGSGSMTYGGVPMSPQSDPVAFTRNYIVRGFASIQERVSERPRAFTDKVLRKWRGIIATLPPYENVLLVGSKNSPLPITMESVAQIDQWMEPRYEAMGSVEGRLENVSSHDKLQCVVFDRFERRIECYFTESLKQDVKDGLFGRVAIRGKISYRADGVPVSVKPIRIKVLRNPSEMRDPKEFLGAWKLDVSAAEYVERLHGE